MLFRSASYSLYSSAIKLNTSTSIASSTTEDVKAYAEDFVTKYNEALDTFDDNKNRNTTLHTLYSTLASSGATNASALESIGITRDSDTAKLTIDRTTFETALASNLDTVKSTLSSVGKTVQSSALSAMTTSSADILRQTGTTTQSALSENAYYEALFKMASNNQFMNFYNSSTALFSMFNMYA